MQIKLPYIFLILLITFLSGCFAPIKTFTPDAQVSGDAATEKIPIEVYLQIASDLEDYIFQKDIYRPTNKFTYSLKIDIGTSSRNLFIQGLGQIFEQVTVISSNDTPPRNGLIFQPHISDVDARAGATIDEPQATIQYEVIVMTTDDNELLRVQGNGHGTYEPGLYALGSLVGNIITLNTMRGTDVNYEHARAFANAEVAAFEDVIRNLKRTPAFATYVAVAIENQR